MDNIKSNHIAITIVSLKLFLIIFVVLKFLPEASAEDLAFNNTFFWFLLAGFLAQLVDGALGMAYGVTSNTVLLSFGLSPRLASTAVHASEIFTTGISGLSHIKFGNFDRTLFLKLLIPGVISASVGAYLLGNIIDGNLIKPYINLYLMVLGIIILIKALKPNTNKKGNLKYATLYATIGGFLDSIGGGGWGPIVTSNLIRQGNTPKIIIGTVNTVEFFVTFFSAGILIYFTGIQSWQIILGLILGGTLAAPLGAYMTKRISAKNLMIIVSIVIIITSLYSALKTWYF